MKTFNQMNFQTYIEKQQQIQNFDISHSNILTCTYTNKKISCQKKKKN